MSKRLPKPFIFSYFIGYDIHAERENSMDMQSDIRVSPSNQSECVSVAVVEQQPPIAIVQYD